MSRARTVILDRVREAQRTGRIPAVDRQSGAPQSGQASSAVPLLGRFIHELGQLGVSTYVEETAEAVRGRVKEIVAGRSVLAWDAEFLPYGVGGIMFDAATGASPRQTQAAADIGVTGCDAAIAETGSLMLLSAPGKPRTASLLPPVHLAIVKPSELRLTMAECFSERADDISAAACCTFVTGPSRTADIELTLTLGVHGPARVVVIVGP